MKSTLERIKETINKELELDESSNLNEEEIKIREILLILKSSGYSI
jgi:hypothetical protein